MSTDVKKALGFGLVVFTLLVAIAGVGAKIALKEYRSYTATQAAEEAAKKETARLEAKRAASNPPCNFVVPDSMHPVDIRGAIVEIPVATSSTNCTWSAKSEVYWIGVREPQMTGDALASVTIAGNPGPARAGYILIAGKKFLVLQEGK